MSSINSASGQIPLASSLAGISSSAKNSSAAKTAGADGSAAKVVNAANAEAGGLMGSEKSGDRDVDGRQLLGQQEENSPSAADEEIQEKQPPRSKNPQKLRGNTLDLDA